MAAQREKTVLQMDINAGVCKLSFTFVYVHSVRLLVAWYGRYDAENQLCRSISISARSFEFPPPAVI